MSVFDSIMILIAVVVALMIGYVVFHFAYTYYHDRQWRKNNKDEWVHQEAIRRGYESED